MIRNLSLTSFLLFFCGSLFCQSLEDLSFGSDTTLEVVTWNIEWFPKNGNITVDSVSVIIEALDADVLGLQEIDDTTACREMIDNLPDFELFIHDGWFGGLAYVYKPSVINIQSIYKIYETEEYWNAFPRSPVVMEMTYLNQEFVIINNHFKCCGDGQLEIGNSNDEEGRRYEASTLLKEYIDLNFPTKRVMVIGDLNDLLTDFSTNNVFLMYIEDPLNYEFADMDIAMSSSSEWSFPNWPSHLDHILVTNEIFEDEAYDGSETVTIKVDDFMEDGFDDYDQYVSDHRPIGIKMSVTPGPVSVEESHFTDLQVYPNPSNGHITINLSSFETDAQIQITDLNGRIILNQLLPKSELQELEFDAPAGMYVLSISGGAQTSITKLMVK